MNISYLRHESRAALAANQAAHEHENVAAGIVGITALATALGATAALLRGAPPPAVALGGSLLLALGIAYALVELHEARRLRRHADMLASYAQRTAGER